MAELSKSLFADLRAAFATEAMTVQRYTYFAQVAEIEGHVEIADLFGELAESVACAAHGHIDFLQHIADPSTDSPIGETRLNLASALSGGLREATETYPRLAGTAHTEGLADVASWLETLSAHKKAQVAKIDRALTALAERDPAVPEQDRQAVDGVNG